MKHWDELNLEEKVDRLAEHICHIYSVKEDKQPDIIPGYEVLNVKQSNEGIFKWRNETFGRKW